MHNTASTHVHVKTLLREKLRREQSAITAMMSGLEASSRSTSRAYLVLRLRLASITDLLRSD